MKMTYNLVVFKLTPPQSAASLRSSATIVQHIYKSTEQPLI